MHGVCTQYLILAPTRARLKRIGGGSEGRRSQRENIERGMGNVEGEMYGGMQRVRRGEHG